jgi:hypothetical protein
MFIAKMQYGLFKNNAGCTEAGKRKEITRLIILPKALARDCGRGKTENIIACAGVVQCDYHEHAE